MSRAKRPLLLFFTSVRSGPSRRMESVLAQVARKERRRLDVVRVDIEEQADLASRLRVNATPTLVLVVDKRVVGRLAGRASGARIASFLGAYLGVGAAS